MPLTDESLVFLAYVGAFGLATLACAVALRRAVRIEDAETRYGFVGLLVGSGGWAASELAFLVVPTGFKYAAYQFSLLIGLTTVGAWLYFCSAYTGRSFHRNRAYRRIAVAVYLGIVAIKLTNPIHGLYFTTEFVTQPFPHLTIQHGTVHWIVTGLSYALVSVGFFMLYELFLEADYDTRPLGGVVLATGLPVVFDVVGFTTTALIDINYESLGVAVFAVGTLYVLEERFLAVQLTDGVDEPVVYLDSRGRISEFNDRARELFPSLPGSVGEPVGDVLPSAVAALDSDPSIIEHERDGSRRFFLVSDTDFTLGQTDVGGMLVFSDVTETERRRRELERQNEQLEGFAAAIRHELLNTLQIVHARVDIAGEALDGGEVATARDSLQTAAATADRMEHVIDDLSTLARHSTTLDETRRVPVEDVAWTAWENVDTGDTSLAVDSGGDVDADPLRLRELFESAFRFAVHNGASTVTVAVEDGRFTITGDGDPLPTDDPERVFEFGGAIPDQEAGMTLPNLETLARVHGWSVSVDRDYEDGVRLVVADVRTRPASSSVPDRS